MISLCFIALISAEHMLPKVWMVFNNQEHGYEMFKAYALGSGFATKRGRSNFSATYIMCSKSGGCKFQESRQQRTPKQRTRNTGCKVYMKLKHMVDLEGICNGKVIIEKIHLHHNHTLSITYRIASCIVF